ncbi:hypothetical protein EAI_15017 [Harpegnathos saltator]|uniref:C2H2-type domain-containing protein n=1 Tax=Harpegnathos saltator TaxID=610380 RepID=E2C2V1_HARSA|nr:hypothetical protein EAI_15017 [Harpegnathos saltator]
MVYDEMTEKSNFIQEQPLQCSILSKRECIGESLVVGEEIVVGSEHLFGGSDSQETDTAMYFNHDLEDCNRIDIEYEESNTSIPLTENSESEFNNIYDEQDGDEETIATFVTAAGQQLALYAVENSEEIYAVALYDESGEPPTSFQFLMKADVERLIGEGAVRTVKKPTQMKKRLLTTQSSVFLQKEDFEEMVEQAQADINNEITTHNISIDGDTCIAQQGNYETEYDYKTTSRQNYSDSSTIPSASNDIIYNTAETKPDITTYLLMNDCPMDIGQTNKNEDTQKIKEIEEPMERTTVQYILLDEDQSDSELTFDEIQRTLEKLKKPRRRESRSASVDSEQSDKKSQDDYSCIKREILRETSMGLDSSLEMDTSHFEAQSTSFTAQTPSENESDDRQRLIDALTDSPTTEKTQPRLKRSRKQQLTSMNRDDGEIIIQPASMLSEEELTGKKRGRRRRSRLPQVCIEQQHTSKKIKRKKRQKVVEVIDLDVDEEEQQKQNVVEITLDDSKDDSKYSSDKENEIIMVRDSDSDNDEDDDEEREEEEEKRSGDLKLTSMMQCKHCSRSFRQRRAFDTHLRVCQKSPENAVRLNNKRKVKEQVRKQYACKICQEKFDVVVALARHVRAEHSQRKKQRGGSASQKTQDKSLTSVQQKQSEQEEENADTEGEEEDEDDKEEKELSDDDMGKRELRMLSKVKRKQQAEEDCSWESKKFRCANCGKYFLNSALLDEHSLQHDAKKSEPQVRKCHICKKIMKSKLLLLRHIKMHNARYNSSSGTSQMLRRRLRTRPSTRIMSLRKRGRPRKF